MCANPDESLTKAALYDQLTNGASNPGRRPVIVDTNVLKGELAVLKIYCPQKLPDLVKLSEDLKLDAVVKE